MACRGVAAHTDIDLANSRKRSSAHLKVDVDLRAAPQGLPLAVLADGKAAIGLGLPDVPADGAVGGARQGGEVANRWSGAARGSQGQLGKEGVGLLAINRKSEEEVKKAEDAKEGETVEVAGECFMAAAAPGMAALAAAAACAFTPPAERAAQPVQRDPPPSCSALPHAPPSAHPSIILLQMRTRRLPRRSPRPRR